jgi:hypothetical protein
MQRKIMVNRRTASLFVLFSAVPFACASQGQMVCSDGIILLEA